MERVTWPSHLKVSIPVILIEKPPYGPFKPDMIWSFLKTNVQLPPQKYCRVPINGHACDVPQYPFWWIYLRNHCRKQQLIVVTLHPKLNFWVPLSSVSLSRGLRASRDRWGLASQIETRTRDCHENLGQHAPSTEWSPASVCSQQDCCEIVWLEHEHRVILGPVFLLPFMHQTLKPASELQT